jgi:hypothetical protein
MDYTAPDEERFAEILTEMGIQPYVSGGRWRLELAEDQMVELLRRVASEREDALAAAGRLLPADARTERAVIAAEIAYNIRAELVCCDIYERLSTERDEHGWRTERTRGHHLCYWGEASARIAESHARVPVEPAAERVGEVDG